MGDREERKEEGEKPICVYYALADPGWLAAAECAVCKASKN